MLVPTGITEPGLKLLVMVKAQLSVAVGGVQLIILLQFEVVMLAGHPDMTGDELSTTVTLNEQVEVFPYESTAV